MLVSHQLAKPAALAKLRVEINNELEKATKRLASQTKKAQKMWTKVRRSWPHTCAVPPFCLFVVVVGGVSGVVGVVGST